MQRDGQHENSQILKNFSYCIKHLWMNTLINTTN